MCWNKVRSMLLQAIALCPVALCLAVSPVAPAQSPAVTVQIRIETTGQVFVEPWPLPHAQSLAAVLSEVVPCRGKTKFEAEGFGEFRCSNALRREGLSLETDFDLAPIARQLQPWEEIALRLDAPRLGFASSSVPLTDEGGPIRAIQTAHFAAGAAPHLHIQFGYRRDQLAAYYLPFLVMGLALFAIALALSRAGLANLNLSVFLLGTILWMGAAARLHAGAPLEILLFGNPFARAAALLMTFLPPLLCVAAGIALGVQQRDRSRARMFSEFFWGYGVFLLPVACAAGALPAMMDSDWLAATPWLLALPAFVLFGRIASRARVGSRLRPLSSGELFDRIAQLAAQAGWRKFRIYISTSAYMNAFALPGRSIFFTTPLLRSLPRREIDAVAAHELSHVRHASNRPWLALAIAMVLFETSAGDLVLGSTGGFTFAVVLPVIFYLAALRGVRKREFQADAGAVRLAGDPRALIGALARIARSSQRPLPLNPVAEWFSTHPSTLKRIRAMAAAGGIPQAELETLLTTGVPGEPYPLPTPEGSPPGSSPELAPSLDAS